jgi:hypothetical protein
VVGQKTSGLFWYVKKTVRPFVICSVCPSLVCLAPVLPNPIKTSTPGKKEVNPRSIESFAPFGDFPDILDEKLSPRSTDAAVVPCGPGVAEEAESSGWDLRCGVGGERAAREQDVGTARRHDGGTETLPAPGRIP